MKWGILIKKKPESLVFAGLEISRDYYILLEVSYGYTNDITYAHNIFIRGAGAPDASYAGVFSLSLFWSSAHAGRDVGFRCAK